MEAICKPDYDNLLKAHYDAEKALQLAKDAGKSTKGIVVPTISFHDIYGVWFFGQLKMIICTIGIDRFGVNLEKTMHVFVNEEPKKISDGIHEITVYGHSCHLYKWMAQGYHRGLIVLSDDERGNQDAEVYLQSGTWSWILKSDSKA